MRNPNEALRAAYPKALATLVRVFGRDLDAAQEALHIAAERALKSWTAGLPRSPEAWLVTVAQNVAIDAHRRTKVSRSYVDAEVSSFGGGAQLTPQHNEFRDDMLRLIFTCCHPQLAPDSQVALTLHTVVGLSVVEIADVYLCAPKAMERRLTRARGALRNATWSYEVPDARDLSERLEAVCAVILVIFNDGYTPSGDVGIRGRLCELAIRLGRLVARLFPEETEVSGLLGLMLLHHSRSKARTCGSLSLEEQDRALWERTLILEGNAIVERALRRKALGPYQIQAAISAVHCSAESYAQTDWPQVVALYDVLLRYQPTSVVRLNRAIAVSRAQGVEAGLELVRELEHGGDLEDYRYFHAALGHLLEESGAKLEALDAFARAESLATNAVEREYLAKKMKRIRLPN